MKKVFTLMFCAGLLTVGNVQAQQIKGDFDKQSVWAKDSYDETIIGITPDGWSSSNVDRLLKFPIVFEGADRLNPDGKSVKLENKYCGAMGLGANAPSFVTLGTFWSYAWCALFPVAEMKGFDGGTFGGMEFTYRPDSIVGYIKRSHGTENPQEKAQILAYLWTGTSTSLVKQGLSLTEDIEPTEMKDRDRDILGMTTNGVSGNAKLVGKVDYSIMGDYADWYRLSLPIDYKDETTIPEKVNVIISSADYFNSTTIGTGNTLWADDFKFVYNTNLKEFTVDGVKLDFFNEYITDYQLSESEKSKLQGKDIKLKAYGKNAVVASEWQGDNFVVTVTDNTSKAKKINVYTIKFAGVPTVIQLPATMPAGTYGAVLDNLGFTTNNTDAPFTYTFSNNDIAKVTSEGKIQLLKVGTVEVTASQSGSDNFAPASSSKATLTVTKALLTVGLKEANSEYGKEPAFSFNYTGFVNGDTGDDLKAIFEKQPSAAAYNGNDKVTKTTKSGVYPIRWSVESKDVVAYNYDVTLDPISKNLTVSKKNVKVSINFTVEVGTPKDNIKFIAFDYTGLLTADRQKNETSGKYEPKPEFVTSGSAKFVSCSIPENTPQGKYKIVFSCDMVSDFYQFTIDEESYLSVKMKSILEAGTNPAEITYGASPFTLDIKSNVNLDPSAKILYYSRVTKVASIDDSGLVTVKGAGDAKFEMYFWESDNMTGVPGSLVIDMKVKKAPFTVKAKDMEILDSQDVPVDFKLELSGYVNGEDSAKVFKVAPSASVEGTGKLPVGTYPIVVVTGESNNYELTAVNGVLTVKADPVSIGKAEQNEVNIYVSDKRICADGFAPEEINVYTIQGLQVQNMNLLANTIYIVKVGSHTTRVLVK